jgi:DNA-binding MarR family transcriptional regulator
MQMSTPPPLWRNTDPETSREAGVHMLAGGQKAMQAKALQAVRDHPGATATELAEAAGIGDPRKLNRRLPELERAGLVERGETRRRGGVSHRQHVDLIVRQRRGDHAGRRQAEERHAAETLSSPRVGGEAEVTARGGACRGW